ncbi:hypothetical protein [Streptomyces racemochromogenes]|uniref:hypothetical protein n=1 Tax=Streptomyces racemochromogenes TaxID=67353 RepID=UPI0035E85216
MTDRIEFESVRPEEPPTLVAFFWMMTVQTVTRRGPQFMTLDGTINLRAGVDTRKSAYGVLLAHMRQAAGVGETDPIVTLAYVLEPNEVPGGAS